MGRHRRGGPLGAAPLAAVPARRLPRPAGSRGALPALPLQGWSKIVEGLAVKGGRACYLGRPLVTSAGAIAVAADMPDGAEIH